jgi:hypothetical protein
MNHLSLSEVNHVQNPSNTRYFGKDLTNLENELSSSVLNNSKQAHNQIIKGNYVNYKESNGHDLHGFQQKSQLHSKSQSFEIRNQVNLDNGASISNRMGNKENPSISWISENDIGPAVVKNYRIDVNSNAANTQQLMKRRSQFKSSQNSNQQGEVKRVSRPRSNFEKPEKIQIDELNLNKNVISQVIKPIFVEGGANFGNNSQSYNTVNYQSQNNSQLVVNKSYVCPLTNLLPNAIKIKPVNSSVSV